MTWPRRLGRCNLMPKLKKASWRRRSAADESDDEAASAEIVTGVAGLSISSGDAIAHKGPVRGLKNLGNTCFLNSVLQNVVATPCLSEHFLAESIEHEGPMTKAMRRFVQQMHASGTSAVAPTQLLQSISKKDRRFAGRNQQDSQEALRQLLEGIRSEEEARLKRQGANGADGSNGASSGMTTPPRVRRGRKARAAATSDEASPANSDDSGGESAEETALQPLSPCTPDRGPPSSAAAAEPAPSQKAQASPAPPIAAEGAAPSSSAPAPAPARAPDPTTVVDDWFGGQLRSTVLCLTCGTVSCSHEPFLVGAAVREPAQRRPHRGPARPKYTCLHTCLHAHACTRAHLRTRRHVS